MREEMMMMWRVDGMGNQEASALSTGQSGGQDRDRGDKDKVSLS